MSNEAPMGWYPDPDDADTLRYWDGTLWTEHTSPATSDSRSQQSIVNQKAAETRRRVPLWVAITTGVVGLVLGSAGSVAGGSNGASPTEVATLEEGLTAAEAEAEEAEQALEEAQQDLKAAEEDFEAEKTALTLQAEESAQLAEEATARATTAEAELEAQPPAAEEPVQFAEAPAAAPDTNSTSYDNCTAVRNAGAAPIYSDQPGYGRHLDRDGDGVGCE